MYRSSLDFSQPSWAESRERRRAGRRSVEIAASIGAPGAEHGDATIRDISPLGFMAETEGAFAPGSYVKLELPGIGSHIARVVWAAGRKLGCEFVRPLKRTFLNAALATSCALFASAPGAAAVATGSLSVSFTVGDQCSATSAAPGEAVASGGSLASGVQVQCARNAPYMVSSEAPQALAETAADDHMVTVTY